MIIKKLGARIRELRLKTGLSQEKFSLKSEWIELIMPLLKMGNEIFQL